MQEPIVVNPKWLIRCVAPMGELVCGFATESAINGQAEALADGVARHEPTHADFLTIEPVNKNA